MAQKEKGTNENRIIAYASRALTPVEKRYLQTEWEALSIVWGIEYFYLYLFGAPFTLYMDHKPLELIYEIRSPNPLQEFKGGFKGEMTQSRNNSPNNMQTQGAVQSLQV